MRKITFLHFSDLHIGDRKQNGLISQTKKILFDDIEFILKKIQQLDVVFFTGDLVQEGTDSEFDLLEQYLKDLWQLFEKFDQNPFLFCVPGNHDLERLPDCNDPIQKVLTNWVTDEIKSSYFWVDPNQYHDFINKRFRNYLEWYKNTSIRKPEDINWGFLPGDYYTTIYLNNIKLGIVGLNSSFLQLNKGDFKKKLGIYNKQISYLFGDKYCDWQKEKDLTLLLTHHSSEWFEQQSLEEYNQEIYYTKSFSEHLCGHMHEPTSLTTSVNGFPSKRFSITPSLFGLDYYGENSTYKRTHGYTGGFYYIDSDKIFKTTWPRISIRTKSEVIKIIQNDDFNLEKESSSLTEVISDFQEVKIANKELDSFIEAAKKTDNLFDSKTLITKDLPRTLYKIIKSHLSIRFQERNLNITRLKDQRYCWIVSKFGLGEDEFIGSFLSEANINVANCFCLNCDEVISKEQLIDTFNKIFSLNITKFFNIINTLDQPLLVFNHLTEELVKNSSGLKDLIQTIFDFSPNLKVIITSENPPNNFFPEYVELFPLDIPAVKQYVEQSQELPCSFTFLEYEKIHRISSGIPFYIDKVIEQLKFRPLSDLGEMEFEYSLDEETEKIPKSLKNEINQLQSDETEHGSRRYTLLTVLSLLHNGETFERVRKFNPTKPFHPDNISYLLKNKLIETTQVNSIFEEASDDSELIKIIKVPRVIRDYISSLLSDEEKVEIYKQACTLYLGDNWRTTVKMIRPKNVELELIVYQNLQIAIRFILSHGVENNNEFEVTRMTNVAVSLVEDFSQNGAYKEAFSLAEEILLLIKEVNYENFENTRTFLTKSLGQNLRMTSFYDKSITILKSICDDEKKNLSKNIRNHIRLNIAYAYETLNKEQEALYYANLIKKDETNKNGTLYLSAESVIAHFVLDKTEKLSKLNALKAKAAKFGHNTLKANIILEICRIEKDKGQIKQLDKIISESKNDIYNKIRALVVKSEIILGTKKIEDITNEDLLDLNISYSYSFYQRLKSLLTRCHDLAWLYWSKQRRFDHLLNLFRYSSFVWRLCGDLENEQENINKLQSDPNFIEWFKNNSNSTNSIYYNQRVFALYNNGIVIKS
jgi:DNA repair exonuclease SbcCD nuclease subunit